MASISVVPQYVPLMTNLLLKPSSTPPNIDSQKKHLQHVVLNYFKKVSSAHEICPKKHLGHIMLHCIKKGSNAKDSADDICTVDGCGTTISRPVRHWFTKFKAGNFAMKEEDRSGRLARTNTDITKSMFAENPRCCVGEIVPTQRYLII